MVTSKKPNILFLMSDQHTQKITGCYGDPLVRTPHLNALAQRGVAYLRGRAALKCP